jgi:hypothetical protein
MICKGSTHQNTAHKTLLRHLAHLRDRLSVQGLFHMSSRYNNPQIPAVPVQSGPSQSNPNMIQSKSQVPHATRQSRLDQPPIMTMLRFRMDFKRSIPACFGFLLPTAMEMTSIKRSSIREFGS